MMISLDTETTGLDLYHGAKPFFVTIMQNDGLQRYWQWDVDPLTRDPIIPPQDLQAIGSAIFGVAGDDGPTIVMQNGKFDVAALAQVMPPFAWPWAKTHDTLSAGHLLRSDARHNLTDQARVYLKTNIDRYEDDLEKHVKSAVKYVKRNLKTWRLAKAGLPDMPSINTAKRKKAKEKGTEHTAPWKYDSWLPRALAKHLYDLGAQEFAPPATKTTNGKYLTAKGTPCHPYWTCLQDYGNKDSEITLRLFIVQKYILEKEGLWDLYNDFARKLQPISHDMKRHGVTVNGAAYRMVKEKYSEDSRQSEAVCVSIADAYGHELKMPRTGNNLSMSEFCFSKDYLNLPVLARTPTGRPKLDKYVLEAYTLTLPQKSPQLVFCQELKHKRSRDTALTYLRAYERYWIPLNIYDEEGRQLWMLLHPDTNPTGTNTLRWSSENPNEQNISRKRARCRHCADLDRSRQKACVHCDGEGEDKVNPRWCFGPTPDEEWWSADGENLELRLPAYRADERVMIDLFERPDEAPYFGSYHSLVAHILHKVKFEECVNDKGQVDGRVFKKRYADTLYSWTKNGNFADQYGAQEYSGTADRAYHVRGAQRLIKGRLTRIAQLSQSIVDFANTNLYVETMPRNGAARGYPLWCTQTSFGKILPTVPFSYYIQGTACEWMGNAMIKCDAQLKEWSREGYRGRIVLQVHDELVFALPRRADPRTDPNRSNIGRVRQLLKLIQLGGQEIGVPTPTSCEYHPRSWGEGFSIPIVVNLGGPIAVDNRPSTPLTNAV